MNKVTHPAKSTVLVAVLFLFLAMVMEAVAMGVPAWSRINSAVAIKARALSLSHASTPSVTAKSTLNIGLYEWCLSYGDDADTISCSRTEAESIPSHGDSKCISYFRAAQLCAPLALGLLLLSLILSLLYLKVVASWKPANFWRPPKALGLLSLVLCATAVASAIAAYICWILLAERGCDPTLLKTGWGRFQGYSTGFIFQCFAAGLAFLAMMCLGVSLCKLGNTPTLMGVMPKEEFVIIDEPLYPVTAGSPYMAPAGGYTQENQVDYGY